MCYRRISEETSSTSSMLLLGDAYMKIQEVIHKYINILMHSQYYILKVTNLII